MSANTFYKMAPDPLHTWGVSFYSVVQNADPYAISAGDLTAMNNANTNLAAAITAVQNAENAFHAAVAVKEAARVASVEAIKTIAKQIYANDDLTEGDIAATGLAIHDTTRTPVTIYPPANPVVNAYANGSAILEWARNGNPYTVTFQIESSTDGTNWTSWGQTTKTRITVADVEPGVTRWFRIRTVKSTQTSFWSATVSVYGPEEEVELQLAA